MENKPALSTSEFYMWRALLAIAWADGNCGDEEMDYFAKVFDNLSRYFTLSDEQRCGLADDLETAGQIDEFMPFINDPQVRDTLLCFANDLVMLDGELHPDEDWILRKMHVWVDNPYNREQLRAEIKEFIAQRTIESEKERQALHTYVRSVSPVYAALDRLLMRLGIDIIE